MERFFGGTHIAYYVVCKRKLWLFMQGIGMEHSSDLVHEGRLIGENSYAWRAERYRELQIEACRIDFFDPQDRVVHEVKKSNRMEPAHIAQLKYYLYVLERNGISPVSGILEYPKLRERKEIFLDDHDRQELRAWESEIAALAESRQCPPKIQKTRCKSCAYYDFCYVSEADHTVR